MQYTICACFIYYNAHYNTRIYALFYARACACFTSYPNTRPRYFVPRSFARFLHTPISLNLSLTFPLKKEIYKERNFPFLSLSFSLFSLSVSRSLPRPTATPLALRAQFQTICFLVIKTEQKSS